MAYIISHLYNETRCVTGVIVKSIIRWTGGTFSWYTGSVYILGFVQNVDAVIRLDELAVPVPAARNIPRVDLTVQIKRLTQQHSHVL